MITITFFLLIAVPIICSILCITILPVIQSSRRKRKLLRHGIVADAVLLHIERRSAYINKQEQVTLQLQIQPANGRKFVSEARELITRIDLASLQIGHTMRVKYSPAYTKEVVIYNERIDATAVRNETFGRALS